MKDNEGNKILLKLLRSDTGYFIWSFIQAGEDNSAWLWRVPRKELFDTAPWLKSVRAMPVHLCRSGMLGAALKDEHKERTVAHSGFVKESKCLRCKVSVPSDTQVRFDTLATLHSLEQS